MRPMLGEVELQQVQQLETDDDQVLAEHAVPALEGDFLQRLNRRATQVTLTGVLTGSDVGERLKTLRDKFHAAEPVPFVTDITTATQVDQVLIEDMGVRELAGKPERFEYALTLREFIVPPEVVTEEPPEPDLPEPPDDDIDQNLGTLIVEVIVEGQPSFDFSQVTVTVQGTTQNGEDFSRTLTNREGNVWLEEDVPASQGEYTISAVVSDPTAVSGSAKTTVQPGQIATVKITLRLGATTAKAFVIHFRFDNAFIEPCMRSIMRQVADYANNHPGEKLVLVGHTDLVGSRDYNQSLSERRARSAHAYLTFGRDPATALDEWDQLRQNPGALPSINDTWDVREYQYILQDLGYYAGNIDEDHGPITDSAVRAFQQVNGLTPDGFVSDQTWSALIEGYLGQDALAIPEIQFIPNCPGEIMKWTGCGEQDPVRNTQDAWRPNRRTELIFIKADTLPCEMPKPDTFDLPTPGASGSSWCLGPGNPNSRCCFLTRETEILDKWLVQPAEPGTITVRGSIMFEDGTPLSKKEYVLIAPDGEYMDGERPRGSRRGLPIHSRTATDGTFAYPGKQKGIGIYTLEINGPYIARLAEEPSGAAKGNVVCKRLDGTSNFEAIVAHLAITFDLQVSGATRIGGPAGTDYLSTREASGDVIIKAVFPTGTAAAPRSITWALDSGEEVPGNPLQRRVTRASIGQTTVTAAMPSSGVTRSVDIFVVRVTLDVDADRDGVVEDEEQGRNTWEYGLDKKGAVILCNNDNDDKPAGNTEMDNRNIVIDGADDVSDLSPLIIRQSGPLPVGVRLVLLTDDQSKIRVFDQRNTSGTAIAGPAPLSGESPPIVNSATADVVLGMEATQYADDGFNGLIRLSLILREGNTELAGDEVIVRVAPWLLPSHLNITEELYIVETGDNATIVSEIEAIAVAAGVTLRRTTNVDRWMQDTMEVGYSRRPGKAFNVVLKATRSRGLRDYAKDNLLGQDYGYTEIITPTAPNTFDSHGNLEVSPPVTVSGNNFQFGRIYYGRGRPSEQFNNEVRKFLEAQQIQKPFELDTDWLAVGHVDEIISFIPSNVAGQGFKMLFANTTEAINILIALRDAGHGGLIVFDGKPEAISVEDLLDDLHEVSPGDLGWANDHCQARLDGVRTTIMSNLGLADSDIIEIPSLFIENSMSPRMADPAVPPEFDALVPAMANLLVITRPSFADIQLVMPKPFGPSLLGDDQFEKAVREKLIPLGYTDSQIHFVDDYDTYHLLLGEVHCGTNSRRIPDTRSWWEQTDF